MNNSSIAVFLEMTLGCHTRQSFIRVALNMGLPEEYGLFAWREYKLSHFKPKTIKASIKRKRIKKKIVPVQAIIELRK
jgi:hypothetical protein